MWEYVQDWNGLLHCVGILQRRRQYINIIVIVNDAISNKRLCENIVFQLVIDCNTFCHSAMANKRLACRTSSYLK